MESVLLILDTQPWVGLLSEDEVEDEERGEDHERDIEVVPFAREELGQDEGQDAEADSVGDAIAEQHHDDCDGTGEGLGHIRHFDVLDAVEH